MITKENNSKSNLEVNFLGTKLLAQNFSNYFVCCGYKNLLFLIR